MVKRGSQLVQFVNGYWYRRFAGSRTSAAHSAHVARSGGIETLGSGAAALATIEKSSAGSKGIRSSSIRTMTAAAGRAASCDRRSTNVSMASAGPNASIVTPAVSFRTRPVTAVARATRKTQGRKPTPCTMPRTRMRRPASDADAGRPSSKWKTLKLPGHVARPVPPGREPFSGGRHAYRRLRRGRVTGFRQVWWELVRGGCGTLRARSGPPDVGDQGARPADRGGPERLERVHDRLNDAVCRRCDRRRQRDPCCDERRNDADEENPLGPVARGGDPQQRLLERGIVRACPRLRRNLQDFVALVDAHLSRRALRLHGVHENHGVGAKQIRREIESGRTGIDELDARRALVGCVQQADDVRPEAVVTHQNVADTEDADDAHRALTLAISVPSTSTV